MKRISVPVDDETLAVFERLATVSGSSVGKTVASWLEDTVEGAVAMADLMEKARKAPKQAAMEMHAYALGLTDMTSEMVDYVRSKAATQKVMREAGVGAKRQSAPTPASRSAAKGASGAKKTVTPPVGNTGGKLPSNPKKSVRGKHE